MHPIDYAIGLVIAVVMIVGGYQLYFFVQRNHLGTPWQFNTSLDDYVPFWPWWVWIYSWLYYPVILLLVFLQPSWPAYVYTAFSFLVLLAMQCLVFYVFPVQVPERWRAYEVNGSLSRRLLAFLQRIDHLSNSIPSMHVSMATLTGIHLYNALLPGYGGLALLVYSFPVLIAASAVFTKQHYLADLVPGAVFGWAAYRFAGWLLA
ncbi:MAG: phosphatase PAP2 family protein [Rhizobiales bacterium]|nr:phosphatase PAP2 family protein [Hyphomicrobiales bacterium]MBI3672707.1 phosphatase PAP2 family protein [Hyphomicrobiales bacterium]